MATPEKHKKMTTAHKVLRKRSHEMSHAEAQRRYREAQTMVCQVEEGKE